MKSLRDQIISKCVYFTGTQHRTCKAGVVYAEVRGPAGVGGIPCLRDLAHGLTCPRVEWMTDEQVAAEVADIETRLAEVGSRIDRGECMHCGAKVSRYKQSGPCFYAEPCGHRCGQGDAVRMNAGLSK